MSKEAEEFFRQKRVELATRPRMKKFMALVNYEEEGKIMQEYANHKLMLYIDREGLREKKAKKELKELFKDLRHEYDDLEIQDELRRFKGNLTNFFWQGYMIKGNNDKLNSEVVCSAKKCMSCEVDIKKDEGLLFCAECGL